jgi:hypothetical protein
VFYIYLDQSCVCFLDLLIVRFIQQKQIELEKNVIIPNTKMTQIWQEEINRYQGMYQFYY